MAALPTSLMINESTRRGKTSTQTDCCTHSLGSCTGREYSLKCSPMEKYIKLLQSFPTYDINPTLTQIYPLSYLKFPECVWMFVNR